MMMIKRVLIALYFLAIFSHDVACDISSEYSASSEEIDETIVSTVAGKLQGQLVTKSDVSFYSFKGIPYAQPPVGKLRFQAPVPHDKWDGIRPAFEHGNFCANRWGFFLVANTSGGNEDCLFLNVYTPSVSGEKKPVLFWIHGGAFMSGSGDSDLYGADHMMSKDVVLVTINYRYSAFGFLSTGDKHAPGNQGLKDMVLALKWVQSNIESFGGDKNHVTIFGHSSGSVGVNYLMISDMTKGLFKQAIMQSGTSLMPCLIHLDNPLPQAQLLAKRLNITYRNSKDLIEKLQAVPFEDIQNVEAPLFSMGFPWGLDSFEFVPSIEPKDTKNAFLTEKPIKRMLDGHYQKIPMMIGSPSFEGMFVALLFYSDTSMLSLLNENPYTIVPVTYELKKYSRKMNATIEKLHDLYFDGANTGDLTQWLNVYSDGIFRLSNDRFTRLRAKSSSKPIYYYEFSFDGKINFFKKHLKLTNFEGASHGDDLFYLFQPHSSEFENWEVDEDAKLVRERMVTMWTNFAKYGNPTPEVNEIITTKWKPYTLKGKEYFDINTVLTNRRRPVRVDTLVQLQEELTGHY